MKIFIFCHRLLIATTVRIIVFRANVFGVYGHPKIKKARWKSYFRIFIDSLRMPKIHPGHSASLTQNRVKFYFHFSFILLQFFSMEIFLPIILKTQCTNACLTVMLKLIAYGFLTMKLTIFAYCLKIAQT